MMSELEPTISDFQRQEQGPTYPTYPEFKEFQEDWLDQIPTHWNQERFRSQLGYQKGNNPDELNQDPTEEFQIRYLSMEYLRGKESELHFAKMEEDLVFAEEGDILLLWDGSKAGEFIRAKQGAVSSTMAKLFKREENNSDYIYYQLKVLEDYLQNTTVGMGIPHVNPNVLNNLHLMIPPIEEQVKIADFLNSEVKDINNLIELKKELISFIEEKRTTVITNVVTQGLDTKVDKKDTDARWLEEVPEHWEVNIFRRFCNLNQGLQIAQSERYSEPGDNRYRYLTVEDINAGDKHNSDYIEDPPESVICDKDDVLLARTGATGEVISDFHGAFHNNFFKINFDRDKIEKDFLVYYLSNKLIKENLLAKAGLTTVPDLNHRYFLDTTFLLPPKDEQKRIVEYLNAELEKFDKTKETVREGIKRLEEYKNSLIIEAVTGKIDVRGEV